MANSVDPDQTAPIRAVCSGSTLFASILNLLVCKAIICSRRHIQIHFWRFKCKLSTEFIADSDQTGPTGYQASR